MNIPKEQIEQARQALIRWRGDPVAFFTERLDVNPNYVWDKMREVTESVRDYDRTAVKAAHSVSKTYTAARIALWFLYCFGPKATVITTAPSHNIVEEVLWREIRTAHANARVPLGGNVTKTKLDLGDKWFATGFATRADTVTQQATRFQGFHNDYVLVIFDEAAGIEREIWEAKDGLLSTGFCRFLAIGNPTSSTGEFVNCFSSSLYHTITISVFDTPNYKAGKDIIPGISGVKYVEDVKRIYGIESNYYKARVLGQIPDDDVDQLIPLAWIERAENRPGWEGFNFVKRYCTWDVADGGDDLQVFKAWRNKEEIAELLLRGKTVEEAEPYFWRFIKEHDLHAAIIDADGVGRVAVQQVEASNNMGLQIIPFDGSGKPRHSNKDFYNRRNEGHWLLREDFHNNHISIKRDPSLREELVNIRLDNEGIMSRRGFIAIEPKKKEKERLGRSPDRKDAVMMASACFDEVDPIRKKTSGYFRDDEYNSELNSMTV